MVFNCFMYGIDIEGRPIDQCSPDAMVGVGIWARSPQTFSFRTFVGGYIFASLLSLFSLSSRAR